MKGEDDTMAKLAITKMEYNVPNPNNPCSHSFSCAAVVEGVVNDEALREAVEMVCEALRKQLPDEEKADETMKPEDAAPDAGDGTSGSADTEATGDEVAQEAGATHCDLDLLEAISEDSQTTVTTDLSFIACMQDFLQDLATAMDLDAPVRITQLPAVASVICQYFGSSVEASDQAPECDGEGGCGGECHCHGKPTVEEEAWMEEQYRKAAAGMKPGDSADNVKKWMDEAPDGDGATASDGEGADAANNCDHGATTTRMPIPQRQYVHVSLPGGAHISLPEDYVFFGPSRVLENLF